MVTMKSSLVCLLAVAAMFATCDGLKCYVCQGDDCADPFDTTNATMQECPTGDRCATVAVGGLFTRSCAPASNCTVNGCISDVCIYCCDDNLCNSKSIAEGINGTLQCYNCLSTEDSSPCGEPFDPDDDEVLTVPCPDGKCFISNINIPYDGGKLVTRSCAPPANVTQLCGTGCNNMACTTCCSDSLCNGGPLPVPPTQPNGASKSLQDKIFAKGLLVVLLVVLGCK